MNGASFRIKKSLVITNNNQHKVQSHFHIMSWNTISKINGHNGINSILKLTWSTCGKADVAVMFLYIH